MIQRQIDAGDEGRYLVQVAANADVIKAQERSFEWALAATFLTLALALIGSTALAVRFGLRPLRVLQEGVAAIRRGETERVAGEFPQDVAPLALEVNQLLDANREIVERARTQVGNLAHALKTPLSVLINEAELKSESLPEKVREQSEIMRRQVAFYLDRARAAARARTIGSATEVRPVVDGLVRTFETLHSDRGLLFDVNMQDGLRFRGEAQDLTDLIGNLLDNAAKWARERVSIRASRAAAAVPAPFISSSPRSTMTVPDSTEARARRRSSAASGSTNCGPAPASASQSSRNSPRSMAARCNSTKVLGGPARDPSVAERMTRDGRIRGRVSATRSRHFSRPFFQGRFSAGGLPDEVASVFSNRDGPMRRPFVGMLALAMPLLAGCSGGASRRSRRRRRSRPLRRSQPRRPWAACSVARSAPPSATPTGRPRGTRRSRRSVPASGGRGAEPTAYSALSRPARTWAAAAAPIRKLFM